LGPTFLGNRLAYNPVFEFLPIETLVKEKQHEYYAVLGKSDRQGNSTSFIEFMLEIIKDARED
jgi:Fic family protein